MGSGNKMVKEYAIETSMKIFLTAFGQDGQLFADAKEFVKNINDTTLTSTEKHVKVKAQLLTFFSDAGSTLLDIVIKVAWMYLQLQLTAKLEGK